jgi:elongator complex protein 2
MVDVSLSFVSVGANRVAGCTDWGNNNLFAYAAGKFIALYDPIQNRVIGTLRGHSDRVNTVRWITNGTNPEVELVSGAVDAKIIIWRKNNDRWESCTIIKDHKESVTNVAALVDKDFGHTFIASTSTDGTVMIYKRDNFDAEWVQDGVLKFGNKMMESVSLTFLPQSRTVCVATGGLDALIHIYIRTAEKKYTKMCSLSGHQDWIRALRFVTCDDGDVVLASASQDTKIRLWKVKKRALDEEQTEKVVMDVDISALSKGEESFSLSHNAHVIIHESQRWTIMLDALLTGHEAWIHSLHWHPPIVTQDHVHQPMRLLTSSMDRTMMIWSPTEAGIWNNEVRMGEFGGLSGLFGQMGYFSACFSPDANMIMATGYHGAFHLWKKENDNEWRPQVSISGHFNGVMDASWDPRENYFITTSLDQTTRLFTQWSKTGTWHEIARPQIHGYDLECLAFIDNGEIEHRIVTGADEKVLRVFEAPQTFLDSLLNIANIETHSNGVPRASAAQVPALGLSNKAILEGETDPHSRQEFDEYDQDVPFIPMVLEKPPFEEQLLQNTLWPEIQKLYGHVDELVCVATNHRGTHLAAACSAKVAEAACVKIWDTRTWREVDSLSGHTLTVTQIAFSPDDKHMVSVSRDRNIIVYGLDDSGHYRALIGQKGHERIIWGCSWSYDSKFIATGARDKAVKIWDAQNVDQLAQQEGKKTGMKEIAIVKLAEPVTAVEFIQKVIHIYGHDYMFAVGMENGQIAVMSGVVDQQTNQWRVTLLNNIDVSMCHVDTVRRVRWRTVNDNKYQLLSCSTDHSVRVFDILQK